VAQQPVYLGGSIGIAGMTHTSACFSSLLSQADQAMYRAKAAGGGICISDPTLQMMASNQLALETDLRLALATNELTLYYQPVVQTDTGQVASVEALLRWNHAERGLLLPDEVLALARSSDLLWALDCWVLQTVLQQAAHWFAAGWSCNVSLNISASSLRHPDIVEQIAAALAAHDVPVERICIEVSGLLLYEDLSSMREVLIRLKALGLCIALDGIGQDAAVLNALQQLPLDIVKVCPSFTMGLGRDPRDEVMMQSLLMLGQGLDMLIVAEGIEKPEQLAWLQTASCPCIQGHLIQSPVPPEELEHPANQVFAEALAP
jgi:EAL domain-containing protein (putative c-di-GMP-specific phosphodiesterase class I)